MCEIQTGLDVVCFGVRPAVFATLLMLADQKINKNATPFSSGLVRIVSIMIHLHVPSVENLHSNTSLTQNFNEVEASLQYIILRDEMYDIYECTPGC